MENKWQPIETAPKDGTRILLYRKDENNDPLMAIASWSNYTWISSKQDDGSWGGWLVFACRSDSEAFYSPTHWQPLPQPPEVKNDN